MKKDDVDRLFDLLEIYFPGDARLRDKVLKNAWLLVLKPFEPEDVKQAIASHLRECRFFPRVQEVALKCHLPAAAPADDVEFQLDKWDKLHLDHLKAYREAISAALQERGLPPMPNKGCGEWNQMIEAAGIDVMEIIEETWQTVRSQALVACQQGA